jgi:hypothetical protein
MALVGALLYHHQRRRPGARLGRLRRHDRGHNSGLIRIAASEAHYDGGFLVDERHEMATRPKTKHGKMSSKRTIAIRFAFRSAPACTTKTRAYMGRRGVDAE